MFHDQIYKKQLNEILRWKLKINPFKATQDFSELKAELRWENNQNLREFKKNSNTRKNMLSNKKIFKTIKKLIKQLIVLLGITYVSVNYIT